MACSFGQSSSTPWQGHIEQKRCWDPGQAPQSASRCGPYMYSPQSRTIGHSQRCEYNRSTKIPRRFFLACPFFMPTERADDIAFPHPARLPLGASWRGSCLAPNHDQTTLSSSELESCNLGYAKSCPRLPEDRACDAVRFAVVNESQDSVFLQYVLEKAYLPISHGMLAYDRHAKYWPSSHADLSVQKKAECFLQSYLDRKSA
jgi:hypothetical protein